MKRIYETQNSDFNAIEEAALDGCLHGRLLRPGDEAYEETRTIRSAEYGRRPRMIIQAANVADVITAVNFARDQDLTLAIRSGGHSLTGLSTSDDVMLDLSTMKAVHVDVERGVARVQPGATWGEVSEAAQVHGLAIPSGDTASVGVGGLTVGGGIGWLARKYGLTIDSLLSVDIVTADGRLLTASAEQNADLFWAVRGGGGNFGIVTAFEFKAHPVGMIVGGAIIYDAEDGNDVLRRYAEYAPQAPDELTTIVNIMHAPPVPFIPAHMHGKPVIVLCVCCTGDLDEAQRTVEPLRRLGTPIVDITAPMPYTAIYALSKEAERKGVREEVRCMYFRELGDDTIETILRYDDPGGSAHAINQLRVLGGAMARVPSDATAFVHRDKPFMFTAIVTWEDQAEAAQHRAWTERFWEELRPHADGVYVNFLSDEGEERIREAYSPASYDRLAALKARYDPTNLFRLNQNIKPAAADGYQAAAA